MDRTALVTLTADVVAAHVAHNSVSVSDLPNLVKQVHGAFEALSLPPTPVEETRQPAVSARASVKPDSLTCMVCGAKQKTLKRHLRTAHDLTPDEYRTEFGLPASYPMASPNYSKVRSEMALALGLGKKRPAVKKRKAKR